MPTSPEDPHSCLPRTRRRRIRLGPGAALAAVTASLVAALAGAVPAIAQDRGTPCTPVTVPVTLAGQTGTMAATLCTPKGARSLQILVHGHTYNRSYWDAPYEPDTYSYVRHANEAGYATLAVDRLGDGESWRPVSALTTYDNQVDTVHAFVVAAREGAFGHAFDTITLVGHSYGSVTIMGVAGRYHDVDALVVTGGGHQVGYDHVATHYAPLVRPAVLDPKFAGSGYDPGYITPTDHGVFVKKDNIEPELLELNETVLKDTGTVVELATLFVEFPKNETMLNLSREIDIPVFTINGQDDPFFCQVGSALPPLGGLNPLEAPPCTSDEALAAFEKRYYGPDATVEAHVIPGTGHGLTIERTAPDGYAAMTDFIDRHVGS